MADADPQLFTLFNDALVHLPGPERDEFLDRVCAGHPDLRARLIGLLGAYDHAGRFLEPPPRPPLPPAEAVTIAGRYKLLEKVGTGGMGVVHRALDPHFDRDVAVKLLKHDLPAESSAASRFLVEAKITGQLQHPGIPPVYELGELPNGQPFLAMKLVKGRTFRELLRERASPSENLGRLVAVFEQIANAVGCAHSHQVIHRDLKPDNVMVGAHGEVHVMDWGLAKILTPSYPSGRERESGSGGAPVSQELVGTPRPDDLATRSGSLLGTPAYMSPEQAAGELHKLDPRSDVFGLGAILCEVLTGRTPYSASETYAIRLQAIRGEMSESLAALAKCEAEPELIALCRRCLSFQQNERPADGSEVAKAIAAIRIASEERARQAAVRTAEQKVRQRVRIWSGGIVFGILLVVAAGAYALQREQTVSAEARAKVESDLRSRLEEQVYFRTITLAARELDAGDPRRAERFLADCPPAHRGWEWHYLRRHRLGPPAPMRASSHLFALTVAPDGQFLAAGGTDGSIEVWDLERGTSARFDAHFGHQVRGLAVNHTGTRLASAGWDGRVILWETATWRPIREWTFKVDAFAVAFAPDGHTLAAAVGSEVYRWKLDSGEEHPAVLKHKHVVRRIAFAPAGGELAAVDDGGVLTVWGLATGFPRLTLQAHPNQAFDVAFSSDGTRLVTAGGQFDTHGDSGQVKVWSGADGSLIHAFESNTGAYYAAALTPDGRRVLAAGEDGRVHVWDAASGEEALVARGHTEAVWGLAFGTDGRRVYTAGGDHLVRLWDATPLPATEDEAGRHEQRVTATAFDPHGKMLVSASMDGVTRLRHPTTGEVVRSLSPVRGHIHALAFSPNGKYLVSGVWSRYDDPNPESGVVIRDTETWEVLTSPSKIHRVLGTSFSPDGSRLAVTEDHGLAVIDTATWKVLWRTEHSSLVTAVAVGAEVLAFADASGVVTFLDLREGRAVGASVAAHAGRVKGLVYSPDGSLLASAGVDGTIAVWDAVTRKQVCTMSGHRGGAYAVAFAPSGDKIVSGGNDGVVRFWDARTGRELHSASGHSDAVHAVAFHPSGAHFASGGRDGSVRTGAYPPHIR